MYIDHLINQIRPSSPCRMAVAAPEDASVLRAAARAYKMQIAYPILCGDADLLRSIAEKEGIDLSDFKIINVPSGDSAKCAVQLAFEGKADMLMKGMIQTADLLHNVLSSPNSLRVNDNIISHAGIFYSPVLQRLMILTDSAMIPYPDLPTKVKILNNAVKAAKGIGMNHPRVAVIAPIESVNPKMQSTIDAAALTQMNRRGQIRNCIVEGPLAMDLALSLEAAKHKGLDSEVAGRADILLMHDIDVANTVMKTFMIGGNCLLGGVVMGASVPVALTSRSGSEDSKLYSIACAAKIAAQ